MNLRTIRPPPFSRQAIIENANQLWLRYAHVVGKDEAALGISFDVVYANVIYPEYSIVLVEDADLGFDDSGEKILGEFDVHSNTAYIDASLHPSTRDPRRTFVCWHEVGGHGILQGSWLRSELKKARGTSRTVTIEKSLDFGVEDILERQANLYAAHAGAPQQLLYYIIMQRFRLTRPFRYIGPSRYWFDVAGQSFQYDVRDFNDLCRILARHIQDRFGWMSLESLSYRIEELGVVIDESRPSLRLRRTARTTRTSRIPMPTAPCSMLDGASMYAQPLGR